MFVIGYRTRRAHQIMRAAITRVTRKNNSQLRHATPIEAPNPEETPLISPQLSSDHFFRVCMVLRSLLYSVEVVPCRSCAVSNPS